MYTVQFFDFDFTILPDSHYDIVRCIRKWMEQNKSKVSFPRCANMHFNGILEHMGWLPFYQEDHISHLSTDNKRMWFDPDQDLSFLNSFAKYVKPFSYICFTKVDSEDIMPRRIYFDGKQALLQKASLLWIASEGTLIGTES